MNRLADEVSPYLLQHKDNPVDWYPWGDEAFEQARRLDRPLFLSIGYATCHWCHVMAHESFEDPTIGRLLNDAFVCVKVDREERPDVDHIYMSACQAARGRCGWPLTVLLTHTREPFFVATYLPRESRHGVVGMSDLIPRVKDLWVSDRANIEQSARELTRAVGAMQGSAGTVEGTTDNAAGIAEDRAPGSLERRAAQSIDIGDTIEQTLIESFDTKHGGFGGAPKFPTGHNLLFLLERATRHSAERSTALVDAVALTVDAIRNSGTFDQVGGGIHRYATDREWRLPHFEKMLYDQAMYMMACAELSIHRGEHYAHIAGEVADYVLADLRSADGAFYCAEDADSEGEEGRFYTWPVADLRSALPDHIAPVVEQHFGIDSRGNFLDEATGARNGRNVLHPSSPLDVVAASLSLDLAEVSARLEKGLKLLKEARRNRVRPALDDKILTDWNGLMIAALSRLGAVTGDTRFTDAARLAATWVLDVMRSDDGGLLHRYRAGKAGVPGLLNDYAFLLWGLLELFEAVAESRWLAESISVAGDLLDRFRDPDGGGFFMTSAGAKDTLVRPRELTDGAMPSGNSVTALALGRLFAYSGDIRYRDGAHAALQGGRPGVRSYPGAFGGLGLAAELLAGPSVEVVVVHDDRDEGDSGLAGRMAHLARRAGTRRAVVTIKSPSEAHILGKLAPYTDSMSTIDGRPTAYICQGGTCDLPVAGFESFVERLSAQVAHPM